MVASEAHAAAAVAQLMQEAGATPDELDELSKTELEQLMTELKLGVLQPPEDNLGVRKLHGP